MKHHIGPAVAACLLVSLLFSFSGLPATEASMEGARRVFILHSYEKGHVCGQPQHDGLVAALGKAGFPEEENLKIRTYFMDTKRKHNTPELIGQQALLARERIGSFRPHVLVTLDDNAFRTVALNLVDTPIPVVFSGMNGQPEEYNEMRRFMNSRYHPGHNVTGVYEKLHIAR